ncbi:MAG TPA: 16S rRNA (guanine(966)-N(2))-methyltransferase RsmD [Actinomycetota bacterium]|nr:16S rRNA (guanine(966)-N(2))-methyltransferase RsmD [Actinomycetota bacterium]
MRVIAGSAKGRRLKSPTTGTRPMTDRMKESLFSAIGDVDGVSVLDLYAGSGSLGLEALSRGAAQAIFIENARDAIIKLNENIEATGLGDRAKVEWAEVGPILKRGATERVDLIFIDPPYSTSPDSVLADLEALVMGGYLADKGRIVLHRPTKERKLKPLGLKLLWEREYGQSAIYMWAHDDEEEGG